MSKFYSTSSNSKSETSQPKLIGQKDIDQVNSMYNNNQLGNLGSNNNNAWNLPTMVPSIPGNSSNINLNFPTNSINTQPKNDSFQIIFDQSNDNLLNNSNLSSNFNNSLVNNSLNLLDGLPEQCYQNIPTAIITTSSNSSTISLPLRKENGKIIYQCPICRMR